MMEKKIVRATSLFMVLFTVLICVSLCYLPALEVRAQQYVAKQLRVRKEREEREKMWAALSGPEFWTTQRSRRGRLPDCWRENNSGQRWLR